VSWATVAAVAGLGIFHGLNPAMGWLFAVALGQQRRPTVAVPGPRPPTDAIRTDPAGVPTAAAPGPAGPGPAVAAPVAGADRRAAPALDVRLAAGGPAVRAVAGGKARAVAGRRAGLGWSGRLAVLRALPPIAAGHLASVAVVAVAFAVTESAVASRAAAIGGGVLLAGLGLWRLLSTRHFRWVGMRLSNWELATWSFLMSSVHGAGLMLVPVLAHHSPLPVTASIGTALAASALHTVTMLVTAGAIALVVTELLGLSVLRHAWLNVDRLWAVALLAAGAATLLTA
jgi:hypothetical protein